MIALVTGANGFLGSSLVAGLLSQTDYQVRCIVRPGSSIEKLKKTATDFPDRCEIKYGALHNYSICLDIVKNVDIVFHLASAKSGAPAEMFHGSSVTTKCLLDAIVNTNKTIRLVHCSSFSVYSVAELKSREMVNEHTPLERHPEKRDLYAFSKWHQEQLIREYYKKYNIPTVILRPGVIYGPGGTPISTRVGLSVFGVFLFIGGRNILPLTYIDNCAEAFLTVAEKAAFEGETYNIVDDDLITAGKFLSLYRAQVLRLRFIRVPYPLMWLLSVLCEKYHVRSKGQLPDVFTRYKSASMWKPQTFTNMKLKQLGWTMKVPTDLGLAKHFEYLT